MKCYMDTRLNIDRACVWVKVIVGHDRFISIICTVWCKHTMQACRMCSVGCHKSG